MSSLIFSHLAHTIRGKSKLKSSPIIIGINGIDGSGKSVFAQTFTQYLRDTGEQEVVLVSIDNFHHPKILRYQKGRDSAEGFYLDSYNYPALENYVLRPFYNGSGEYVKKFFDLESDTEADLEWDSVTQNSILIVEGIFLFRDWLQKYWDYQIFLEVSFAQALSRNIAREKDQVHLGNTESIIQKYQTRYQPGQQLYLEHDHPRKQADVIIDNNEYACPFIIHW